MTLHTYNFPMCTQTFQAHFIIKKISIAAPNNALIGEFIHQHPMGPIVWQQMQYEQNTYYCKNNMNTTNIVGCANNSLPITSTASSEASEEYLSEFYRMPLINVPYKCTFGAPDQGQTLDVWESQTAKSALRDDWTRNIPHHTLEVVLEVTLEHMCTGLRPWHL